MCKNAYKTYLSGTQPYLETRSWTCACDIWRVGFLSLATFDLYEMEKSGASAVVPGTRLLSQRCGLQLLG